jgi:hypothetical protein
MLNSIQYTMSSKLSVVVESDYTCSICCEKYNNVKIKVLSCKHNLCTTCFKKHSDVSNDCPFCRRNIYKPIVTKKKAVSKTVLSLQNAINSTQLIKSLSKITPMHDIERLKLKELFSQFKQNMIDLGLIIDDSFPTSSNTIFNNNFYLGDFQIEEDELDDEDDEEEETNVNVNIIENRPNLLLNEILSFMMSTNVSSTSTSSTENNTS